jgi:hypothetical protein
VLQAESRSASSTSGIGLLLAATGLRRGVAICTNNRCHVEVIDGAQVVVIAYGTQRA